ncbi:MAG: hypothetical protein QOH88_1180 [Verrucomicrobiota bacterium]|jgi:hypothetical protein
MKLFSICLLAAVFLTFFSGCASDDRGYSSGQLQAQRAVFEPPR